jgi:hypothetical protein
MKTKLFATVCVALALAAAIAFAQDKEPARAAKPDPRIDKLIEQNEQILKNQQEILDRLGKIETGLTQVRRRGS